MPPRLLPQNPHTRSPSRARRRNPHSFLLLRFLPSSSEAPAFCREMGAGALLVLFLLVLGSAGPGDAHGHHPSGVGHHQKGGFDSWVQRVHQRVSTNLANFEAGEVLASVKQAAAVPSRAIVVDAGGKGDFTSLTAALNSIKPNQKRTQRVVIQINAGTYKEKVVIPKNKPFITLQGAGKDVTKITWGDTAGSTGTTIKSATVSISAPNFIAQDITFENSAPVPDSGETGEQAVALMITGDMAEFYRCGFLGAQDTLYDHKGRHYFKDCFIQGVVDFIFGDGLSLYDGCTLNVIQRSSSAGSLTAQKRTSSSEDTGFSFVNCKVVGAGNMQIYLGRAWGAYSRVVFAYTYLADIITPVGWYNWGVPERQSTVFYGQYKCTGPGANQAGRVAWSRELSDAEAQPFLTKAFIDGQQWVQV